MSVYRKYKQYICDSLHGIMSEEHITDLKHRITHGVDTTDELYETYKDHFKLSSYGEQLMSFEVWLREYRLKNLLEERNFDD